MLLPEEEDEAVQAYLFQLDDSDVFAVTLSRSGSSLPGSGSLHWRCREEFLLGVHQPVPAPIDPEPILRGVRARGYFVWRLSHTEPFGTSQ